VNLGDMENVVLPNHMRTVQFVSILIDNLTYCVRSCLFEIQSISWSCHPEVPHRKPDLMYNLEYTLIAAGAFCLTGLSFLQILTENLVSLLHTSRESVCLDVRFQARWLFRGLKLHRGMLVVIHPAWTHCRRSVYRVNVHQFT